MGRFDSLYRELPIGLQNVAVSTYGFYWKWLRFGPGFRRFVNDYQGRERFSKTEWLAWQNQQMQELLAIAASHVSFYRQTWDKGQIEAALNGRLYDLPLLEKEPIRAEPKVFLREDKHLRNPLVFHTSGSTGTPIASYWTFQELRNSLALREARSANWAGVSFKMPRATFSGRIVEPDPDSKGPFYRFNAVEKQVYFSAFHLKPDNAPFYAKALRKHNIRWLTGYAVSYYLLAKFILDQKLKVPSLRAVVTTSEKVTPEMRTVMEEAYGCKVYEEYSTVENALFASECEYGKLHISPDAGVTEILHPDGTPCMPGEIGEVVTTCLMRTYQPLIRFRIGDFAMWDDESCKCGRVMPVLKEVIGRIEDVVIGPDGRQMVRFHGIFVDQPHVQEGQIIQETLDRIIVKVVPINGFGDADIKDIISRVQQRLSEKVEVVVECVDYIPRTKSGKFQAVISLVNPNVA